MQISLEDFEHWVELAKNGDRRMLWLRVKNELLHVEFHRNQMTEWAYCRLATFLDDGATAASQCWKLRPVFRSRADELSKIINCLVSGYRYERDQAERVGAPWVFEDDTARIAAFVFYVTTEKPRVMA